MHEVLVNRLGGLSLPRKSVVRLTDRPNMTFDVYHGHKTTMQQQQQFFSCSFLNANFLLFQSMTQKADPQLTLHHLSMTLVVSLQVICTSYNQHRLLVLRLLLIAESLETDTIWKKILLSTIQRCVRLYKQPSSLDICNTH